VRKPKWDPQNPYLIDFLVKQLQDEAAHMLEIQKSDGFFAKEIIRNIAGRIEQVACELEAYRVWSLRPKISDCCGDCRSHNVKGQTFCGNVDCSCHKPTWQR
jgi:hypothetical protein